MDYGYALLIGLVAFIALMILWIVGGISPLAILRLAFGDGASVNHYQDGDADVMSRSHEERSQNVPLSLRQTEAQTDRQEETAAPSRDVMLNTYRFLRKYGTPREEARTILRALNLPLDNNLWTQAAPPPTEPANVTPIAGRRTDAKFHDDPELDYQPLDA